jgi:hypothetical protein
MAHPYGFVVPIVGIECGDGMRHCERHLVCGSTLKVDSVVRLIYKKELVDDEIEEKIAVHLISDGIDACCVGYLPRTFLHLAGKLNHRVAQVTEMLTLSDSSSTRKKSRENYGMCRAALIDAIPLMYAEDENELGHQIRKITNSGNRSKEANTNNSEKGNVRSSCFLITKCGLTHCSLPLVPYHCMLYIHRQASQTKYGFQNWQEAIIF